MEKKSRKFFPSERWLEDELSYLQQKLAGIPAILELPTDRPRPPVQTFRAVRESIVFSKSLKEALTALAHQERVSVFVLLLAAFQSLLMRYTREDDIVIGILTDNAQGVEVQGLKDGSDATVSCYHVPTMT